MILRALMLLALCFAGPARADVWSFNTPSGNIECWVGEEVSSSDLTCTIFQRNAPMAQFTACPVHRGITAFMGNRGGVDVTCAPQGERPVGGQHVADYGVTGQFGGFSCHSSRKGLECRNQDGHGFFLSRAVQTAF